MGRPELKQALGWAAAAWLGAVCWLISPVDPLPDVVPLLGWLDDVAVLFGAAAFTAWLVARAPRPAPPLPGPAMPDEAPPDRAYDPVPVEDLRRW